MIRYGYSVLPYGDEPLATSFDRVARCGYDTIELLGQPSNFDVREINAHQERTGVQVKLAVHGVHPRDGHRQLGPSDAQARPRLHPDNA